MNRVTYVIRATEDSRVEYFEDKGKATARALYLKTVKEISNVEIHLESD